jgi:hypothetical protein
LKTVISELKQAAEHEVTHLKTVISELKHAAEREEAHLKEVIESLQSRLAQDLRNPRLTDLLLTLARYLRSRLRRVLLVLASPLGFLKRAYLAIRYHYAMGGCSRCETLCSSTVGPVA